MTVSTLSLIGFMGSGKTTIGKYIANKIGFSFLDTDILIQRSSGKTIQDLFDISEAYFRSWEFSICQSLKNKTKTIIATGGGLVMHSQSANILKALGPLIYLKASPETISNRVLHSNSRPILNTTNPQKVIKDLLKQRHPVYSGLADLTIEVDTLSIDEISDKIIALL